MVWLLRFWRVRLPFGCGARAVVLVYLALPPAGFYITMHTNVCTQMNENILPEHLIMVSQGMDWRLIVRTNELAKMRKCHFHQISCSSEQCCRYFTGCIVKNVEKDQYNISFCDADRARVDRNLSPNAVHNFKHSQELPQL